MRRSTLTFARIRGIAAIAVVAVVLTGLSTLVKRARLEVQDWDCPPPPASCARPVVVSGFPIPFISDYHGISAVGDANLVSALLGDDHLHWPPFLADVTFYFLLCFAVWHAARVKIRDRRKA